MTIEQIGSAMRAVADYLVGVIAQVWPVVAPLVGVVIGALLADRQEGRAARSRLTEAKLERLRAAFQPVLLTAWAFSDATSPLATMPQQEEAAARQAMIAEAMTGLNRARVQLSLEAEGLPLVKKFQQLYVAYENYKQTLSDTHAGDIPPPGQQLSDKRAKVLALVQELEHDMPETLAQVERQAG